MIQSAKIRKLILPFAFLLAINLALWGIQMYIQNTANSHMNNSVAIIIGLAIITALWMIRAVVKKDNFSKVKWIYFSMIILNIAFWMYLYSQIDCDGCRHSG